MLSLKRVWMVLAAAALLGAACASPSTGAAPTPTRPAASPTPSGGAAPSNGSPAAPTATRPAATATTAPSGGTGGNAGGGAAAGQAAYMKAGCVSCHGDKAQGNVFPGAAQLAGTQLSCADILKQVRTPRDPSKGMPAFAAGQISDADVNNVCTWVKSLQ